MKQSTEYRLIDTSTIEGLRKAERLHANGWLIARTGLFLIWFYKRRAKKTTKGKAK